MTCTVIDPAVAPDGHVPAQLRLNQLTKTGKTTLSPTGPPDVLALPRAGPTALLYPQQASQSNFQRAGALSDISESQTGPAPSREQVCTLGTNLNCELHYLAGSRLTRLNDATATGPPLDIAEPCLALNYALGWTYHTRTHQSMAQAQRLPGWIFARWVPPLRWRVNLLGSSTSPALDSKLPRLGPAEPAHRPCRALQQPPRLHCCTAWHITSRL